MQINGKDIQNLFVNMVLRKSSNKTQIQRGTFPCFFTWEWAKKIPI
jgi:hypothetical protein